MGDLKKKESETKRGMTSKQSILLLVLVHSMREFVLKQEFNIDRINANKSQLHEWKNLTSICSVILDLVLEL